MAGVLVVTGAGRGIGAAIAELGGARGWKVCVNYSRAKDKAEAVARKIRDGGGSAIAVQADVGKEADIVRLFQEVDKAFGPVTALVNNAGIDLPARDTAEVELDGLHKIFAVNVFGPFLCAREAIRRMSTRRGGKGGVIVNISSRASGHYKLVGEMPYTASKGAVDAFTMGLANEVAPDGIRVACIRPGLIMTEIFDDKEKLMERAKTAVPLGRVGDPMEIATAAIWLCSGEASYVTGMIMDVGGGR